MGQGEAGGVPAANVPRTAASASTVPGTSSKENWDGGFWKIAFKTLRQNRSSDYAVSHIQGSQPRK